MTSIQQEIINAVKKFAQDHYQQSYGYQVYVECYSDEELLEEFGNCKNTYDALNDLVEWASIKSERYEEAHNEIL